MKTRTISYIDENEDLLDIEIDIALNRTMEENFIAYCEFIISNYAIADIDVINYPIKREIYFIEDEQQQ
ncbi:MAG: hypothetical protein OEW67_05690 [Cyclobacteriaceae bacterium]|nr:hypothetical protein [Cyclobacteriaceae bacterium]